MLINYDAYANPAIWNAVNSYIDAFKQNPRVYPEDFGLGAKLEGTPGFEGSQGSAARANAPVALAQANADGSLQKDSMGNVLNANEVIAKSQEPSAGVLPANHPNFELPKVEDVVQSRLPGASRTGDTTSVGPNQTPSPSTQPPLEEAVQSIPETILRDDGSVDPNGVARDLTAEDYGFEGGYTPPTAGEIAARAGEDSTSNDYNMGSSIFGDTDFSPSTSNPSDSYQNQLADGLYLKDYQQAFLNRDKNRLAEGDFPNEGTRENVLKNAASWEARSGNFDAARGYLDQYEASRENRGLETNYNETHKNLDSADEYLEWHASQQRSFLRLPKIEKAIKDVVALPKAQANPDMEQIDPYDTAKLTTVAVERQIDTKHSTDFSSNINEIINFRRDRPPTGLFPNARSGLCRVRRQDGSTEYVPD